MEVMSASPDRRADHATVTLCHLSLGGLEVEGWRPWRGTGPSSV